MRIIHTSDWHLGAQLYEQSRHDEHVKFIAWLKECMRHEKPDALIVSGDIFDTYSPPNASLELYYSFLGELVKESLCRTVVIVGGNHDSAALLDSPDKVLSHLNIKVIGAADIAREVVVLRDSGGKAGLAIGAVPYLRDADIRLSGEGESFPEIAVKLRSGLKKHYQDVVKSAKEQAGKDVPLLLTGHFYLSKSLLSDDLSERTRSIGSLGEIPLELLPETDYYALGHLHVPQAVGGNERCRYSGSPIPMSFGEAGQEKSVVVVDFKEQVSVRTIPIECFQKIEQIKGKPDMAEARVRELVEASSDIWLDVQIDEHEGTLTEFWNLLLTLTANSSVKILKKQDVRPRRVVTGWEDGATLETIKPEDVFKSRLECESLTVEEKTEYARMFAEIMESVNREAQG